MYKLDSLSLALLYRLVRNIVARPGAIEFSALISAPLHSRITKIRIIQILQMGPISWCNITLDWKCLQGTNTLAYAVQ
jgi:hypothetical protein